MEDANIPICKLVLIGDHSVGKSSVFHRFAEKKFSENTLPTVGVDYKIRVMEINGRYIKLMIWDTSGQEKYNAISKTFYSASDGVMVFFSLTDESSFEHVSRWLEKVYNELPKDVPIMLLGTVGVT